MRVVALMENTAGNEKCKIEHGLSFYIETAKHRILMDTGASEQFIANAEALGVDLRTVDTVVISHGHYDHGGGLNAFLAINPEVSVYIQESAFGEFYSITDGREKYIGLPEIDSVKIIRVNGSKKIDGELYLLSEIENAYPAPSANDRLKKKENGELVNDDFRHEQCLVISENGRQYLFGGCAHHGILNVLHAYHKVFRNDPYAVFSGFHMVKKTGYTDEDIEMILDTAQALQKYDTVFYTCHCTGKAPYEAMKKIMKNQLNYIRCGNEIVLNPKKKRSEYMKMHKMFAWGTVFCFAMTMITGYRRK